MALSPRYPVSETNPRAPTRLSLSVKPLKEKPPSHSSPRLSFFLYLKRNRKGEKGNKNKNEGKPIQDTLTLSLSWFSPPFSLYDACSLMVGCQIERPIVLFPPILEKFLFTKTIFHFFSMLFNA